MITLPPAEIAADCQAHCPRFVAVLRRERTQSLALAARLREWGISAVDVESTVLLSKLVAAKLVELLIIDHHIEGFITGMEVVQKMRMAFVRIPVIVLGPNVEMLRQESNVLGPVTFADAGKSTEDLAHLARQVLSRPPQDLDLIPERARALVERQIELPVLSQLIVRLVGYFQTPVDGIPFDDMCRDIAVDPKASVVLFKAANASANGLLRQISSVRDAIRLLGIRRSIGHILNAAIVDGMGHLAQRLPAEEQLWHSRRGLLIASACSTFGEMERRPAEAAFLSGLLQDVGILGMLRLPERLSRRAPSLAVRRAIEARHDRAIGTGLHARRGFRRHARALAVARFTDRSNSASSGAPPRRRPSGRPSRPAPRDDDRRSDGRLDRRAPRQPPPHAG